MKRLAVYACAVVLLSASAAVAQDARSQEPDGVSTPAPPTLTDINPAPTQEMWFYLQELRRYDDPWVMIRRKEEQKAAERRMRLAAMKWFGFSPSRPTANPVPFMGVAAPRWVGNGVNTDYWVGGGYPTTIVRLEKTTIQK